MYSVELETRAKFNSFVLQLLFPSLPKRNTSTNSDSLPELVFWRSRISHTRASTVRKRHTFKSFLNTILLQTANQNRWISHATYLLSRKKWHRFAWYFASRRRSRIWLIFLKNSLESVRAPAPWNKRILSVSSKARRDISHTSLADFRRSFGTPREPWGPFGVLREPLWGLGFGPSARCRTTSTTLCAAKDKAPLLMWLVKDITATATRRRGPRSAQHFEHTFKSRPRRKKIQDARGLLLSLKREKDRALATPTGSVLRVTDTQSLHI